MSRNIDMEQINLAGVPARLVEFLRINETLRIYAPLPAQVTVYVNPLANIADTEPAFTMQVADFTARRAEKVFLTFDEADELVGGAGYERAADILAAAKAQGRRVWAKELPAPRQGAGGEP